MSTDEQLKFENGILKQQLALMTEQQRLLEALTTFSFTQLGRALEDLDDSEHETIVEKNAAKSAVLREYFRVMRELFPPKK